MGEEFKKETITKKDRPFAELKEIEKKKGKEYIEKNIFNGDKELTDKVLERKRKVPEECFLKIVEESGCTYDYLIYNNKKCNRTIKVKDTRARKVLAEIVEMYGQDYVMKKLAIVGKKTLTNMLNRNKVISRKHYSTIAELGKCSIDYLEGKTDIRNIEEIKDNNKKLEKMIKLMQSGMRCCFIYFSLYLRYYYLPVFLLLFRII